MPAHHTPPRCCHEGTVAGGHSFGPPPSVPRPRHGKYLKEFVQRHEHVPQPAVDGVGVGYEADELEKDLRVIIQGCQVGGYSFLFLAGIVLHPSPKVLRGAGRLYGTVHAQPHLQMS